jgi:hypothetical protein
LAKKVGSKLDINTIVPVTFIITDDLQRELMDFRSFYQSIEAYNHWMISEKTNEDLNNMKSKYPSLEFTDEKPPSLPVDKLKSITARENVWILKPLQNANKGKQVTVTNDLTRIMAYTRGLESPAIIQKYIENPFLYKGRKFDIRMFVLITWIQGSVKLFFYDGYIRTSSFGYDLYLLDPEIHITDESVQTKSMSFGRYERGNKLSLADFNTYLKTENPNIDFYQRFVPKMKVVSIDGGICETFF